MSLYFKCRMEKQRPSTVTGNVMVLQLIQEMLPCIFVIVKRSVEKTF